MPLFLSSIKSSNVSLSSLISILAESSEPVAGAGNELSSDIEVQNTDHHKQIIKARNEYYITFKKRFETSVKGLV